MVDLHDLATLLQAYAGMKKLTVYRAAVFAGVQPRCTNGKHKLPKYQQRRQYSTAVGEHILWATEKIRVPGPTNGIKCT